jgi:long-chain acyl-CoA synthetase
VNRFEELVPGRRRTAPATGVTGATIVEVFRATAADRLEAVALRYHDGDAWRAMTWAAYERAVAEVALGLRAAGLSPGDRVGILSGNRPEWHIVDLGILAAGLVSTPVYATAASSQVAHVLGDAGCRVCFVEDGQQLSKVLLRRGELPALERVVLLRAVDGVDDGFVQPLGDLRAEGAAAWARRPQAFAELVAEVRPEHLATLVYTSGTTGPPKGAMLSHANIMAMLRSVASLVGIYPEDRFLSFLPLSHITERSVSHFGQVAGGGETWFARSLASVPDDLRDCRPTLFFAVPRVWEKFRDAVFAAVAEAPPPMRALLHRYLDLANRRTGPGWATATTSDRAAFAALDATVGWFLRHRFGLDRARLLACGAPPVHPDLLRWFHGIGLPVAEGYGQTEVSLCTTMNPPDDIRIGTVGRPIPGVEVRIGERGEVLVRGGGVCQGYWGRPEATAELIDTDGWQWQLCS